MVEGVDLGVSSLAASPIAVSEGRDVEGSRVHRGGQLDFFSFDAVGRKHQGQQLQV